MTKNLFSNKLFLVALGLIAVIGLALISFNASQTNNIPVPTPAQVSYIYQPKAAKMQRLYKTNW